MQEVPLHLPHGYNPLGLLASRVLFEAISGVGKAATNEVAVKMTARLERICILLVLLVILRFLVGINKVILGTLRVVGKAVW